MHIFQRNTFNLEKDKSICYRKVLVHTIQVTGSTYGAIVFQTAQQTFVGLEDVFNTSSA